MTNGSEVRWAERLLIIGTGCRVQFLAWYSIAQSVCQQAFSLLEIGFQRPFGFESCIQQRKTTCLLSIRNTTSGYLQRGSYTLVSSLLQKCRHHCLLKFIPNSDLPSYIHALEHTGGLYMYDDARNCWCFRERNIQLTHLSLVPHLCVNELGHHRLK